MPYFTRDKNGKDIPVPVKITRSPEYKKYYAHGIQGGILSSYHYRLDFYNDHIPPLNGTEEEGMLKMEPLVIDREIEASVYLSLPAAKQLRDWLDKNIKKCETIDTW